MMIKIKMLMLAGVSFVWGQNAFAQSAALTVVKSPKELSTELPLSAASDADGVCQHLGFSDALPGSLQSSSWTRKETIKVDSSGAPAAAPHGKIVSEIICRGIVTTSPVAKKTLVEIKDPKEPQTDYRISANSSAEGVCKLFGNSGLLSESVRFGGKSDVIIIEASGVPSRVELSTKTLDRIVCVK